MSRTHRPSRGDPRRGTRLRLRRRRQDASLVEPGRHPHHGPARPERGPEQLRVGPHLRAAGHARQGPEDRALPRHLVEGREPDRHAVQAAPGRQVPRRHALHRRRRGVLHRARARPDLQLLAVHAGHHRRAEGGRADRRDHHEGPQPGAPAAAHRGAHDEQGVGDQAQRAQAPGLQEQGGDLRLPQRQRHRPLRAEEPRGRREDGARPQLQLVGEDGGQRERDRLPAHQAGRHAAGRPPLRRGRLRPRPAPAGHPAPEEGPEDQGGRGQREPHHLLRLRPVARRTAVRVGEGQEPLQGPARAPGLPARHRRERAEDPGDARARRRPPPSCSPRRSTATTRRSTRW